MPEARWNHIVEKYLDNTCTREELRQLLQWVEEDPDNAHFAAILRTHWERLDADMPDDAAHWDQRFQALTLQISPPPKRVIRYRPWVAAAAAVLLLVAIGVGYYKYRPNTSIVAAPATIVAHDVAPGGNKAMLTLADGSVISLDSAANGLLAQEGGTSVNKRQNGQLAYQGANASGQQQFNTLSVPKGGTYALILPDGSKIWLNSASTLRFPLTFGAERKVLLTGEAYFEIAQDVKHPFIVAVNNTEIKVLGTSFNVMAYQEESKLTATLVEGALAVSKNNKQVILKPGQQANIPAGQEKIDVSTADLDEALAWKNDRFYFNNTDIHTAMRQLERWYDVQVTFRDSLNMRLNGTISRSVNISKVLKMLTFTGEANFSIEEKTVIVGK
ncbi:MAG: DUF4974 domain-containing protein [Chitinophaga sp.]|uniref:FecR family protein n=1 Tax=Chitinophaga sp. TaxID=1869181 RepID=UPI0025BBECDC|nr:FecR domain-containing protein [Chitinophaga sp.]MBV8253265.1 DUF4974 domain-containing protein [Chitinophaga sp.]